jgi:molybdate transport system ATP-binding protein
VPALELAVGSSVRVRIRARDVMLALTPPSDLSALNVLPCRLAAIGRTDGPIVELQLRCGPDLLLARITRLSLERLQLAPGHAVHAVIKAVALDRRSLGQSGRRGLDSEVHEV